MPLLLSPLLLMFWWPAMNSLPVARALPPRPESLNLFPLSSLLSPHRGLASALPPRSDSLNVAGAHLSLELQDEQPHRASAKVEGEGDMLGDFTGDTLPRTIATLACHRQVRIRWRVVNRSISEAIPNVAIHFYIEKRGTEPPGGAPHVGEIADAVLGTDLAPAAENSGEYEALLPAAGPARLVLEVLDRQGHRLESCAVNLDVEDR